MIPQTLRKEERISFALRELYENYGYRRYKMSKFEEYDFYVRNKESLISDGVITFTDTTGKLMALKPDVTLSIIKNAREGEGVQKVYYNENVYRVSPTAHCFKEIAQMGLECMGNIDAVCIYEVIRLAMDSLCVVDSDAVLDISHLGLLSELLTDLPKETGGEICRLLSQKNAHELRSFCQKAKLDEALTDKLCALTALYGTPTEVLAKLVTLVSPDSAALEELKNLCALFEGSEMLRIDPAMTDDMNYYGGFVFKGFIKGVPEHVLSGGQYDKLVRRMGKAKGAVGFALYLDRLERVGETETPPDADVVLLYDDTADIAVLTATANELRQQGSVLVLKQLPEDKRFGRILYFTNGEVKEK